MLNFKEWINKEHPIDTHELDALFKFAQISVEIVKDYNRPSWFPPNFPGLLDEIYTIGNLPSGAYGIYRSNENEKTLPDTMVHGKNPQNPNITKKILQDQLKVNPLQINMKGTVRVNVQRIMKEVTDIWEAIKHIAITIAHEATHQIEREYTGNTSEIGPQKTEQDFIVWLKNNELRLKQKYSTKIPVAQQNPV